ncbi:MAG: hypothetical protein DWQ04_04365, partial [Chloroflexi bacterium]
TEFLLKTAVLDRFCAELCGWGLVAGGWGLETPQPPIPNPQSQKVLEQLDAANLFLVPLDNERRWFRYHRLFADLLRQRLVQTEPEIIPVIHQRAADWFEVNGYPEEAIHHALAGDAAEQAARLIEAVAESKLMRSELVTVKGWLDALPESELEKRPRLSFYYAWALIMEGLAQAKVEQVLARVSAKGAPGDQALVRSFLAVLRADGATAVTLARQALAALAPDRAFFRSAGTWILGMSLLLTGELDQGEETLEQAVQMSQQMGNLTIAASSLGRLANQAWRQCNLFRAKQIYEQALVLATDEGERPLPVSGETHIGLARLYYEWNDLETALHHAETGLDLMVRWREISTVVANLWLARIKQAQGDSYTANQLLNRARHVARRTKGTEFDDIAVAMTEAHLHLFQGNLDAVAAWCAQRKIPQMVDTAALQQLDDITEGHLRKYEFTMLARLRLAQKRPNDALAILPTLLQNAQRLRRRDLQLEICLLTAVATHQTNNYAQSDRHLQQALTLGQPGNFTRIFIETSPEIASLLSRQKPTNQQHQTYLNHLLTTCGHPTLATRHPPPAPPAPLIEPLSPREIEVLSLIAEGLSNKEIAQKLVLSLPTIKWHTSNIYGKLGVGNRVTAVTRARKLHILVL